MTVATLAEVMETMDIVNVVHEPGLDPFIVATPKTFRENPLGLDDIDLREIGSASPSPFTSWFRQEYNRELQGLRGLQKYDQMRRSDGTVRGTLRLVKTPVLAARWFIEPGGTRPKDKKIAEFVWDCLTKYMSCSFGQTMQEALLMCEFGYYMFEKVWEPRIINGTYRIVWKKLGPRHPMDVKQWNFDANGGPDSVVMYPPTVVAQAPDVFGGFGNFGSFQDDVRIPISKLLVFTFDKEANNIEGISMLRTPYKHWYYKEQLYKIDAIQKERHGIGIPMITLPPGFTTDDKNLADQLGRNLRTNERAHVVLPPNWELTMLKLEGQPVSAIDSIQHHDEEIEKSILASFLGDRGTGAKDADMDLFLKATRFIANTIADTFNDYCIPELVDLNFPNVQDYPKLRARRIGENADWQAMSFAVRNMIGAGVIRPDDPLEAAVRDEMDLPIADPDTIREVATPQGGGGMGNPPTPPNATATNDQTKAQPPKQAAPSAHLPAANAGNDRSGN